MSGAMNFDPLSYLNDRDPSIITEGRPAPEAMRRNMEDIGPTTSSDGIENIKVFLRMRPVREINDIYYVKDSTSLVTRYNQSGNANVYTFSHIFDGMATQQDVYIHGIETLVKDFVCGKSATLMTYGTSGSGKTYTLLGSIEQPGVIPRVLDGLFKIITLEPEHSPLLQPFNNTDVYELDDLSQRQIFKIKKQILNELLLKKNAPRSTYRSMLSGMSSETANATMVMATLRYTVWASFLEIYNEAVYDLLATGSKRLVAEQRPKLKISDDNTGTPYCKGLTMIPIRSGEEAFAVLQFGQNNLNYSATHLNKNSSRSHCVFTLQLVIADKDDAFISVMNFCDLAGSERLRNTATTAGKQMKESLNINKSLHVFGRCLSVVFENQKMKDSKKLSIVPYRESSLTKLLKHALLGNETLNIIVNINPVSRYVEETINTLNFSAMAKEIVVMKKPIVNKIRISGRFTLNVCSSTKHNVAPILEEESVASSSRSTSSNDVGVYNEYYAYNDDYDYNLMARMSDFEHENQRLKNRNYDLLKEIHCHQQEMKKKELEIRRQVVGESRILLDKRDEYWKGIRAADKESHKQEIARLKAKLKKAQNSTTTSDSSDDSESELAGNILPGIFREQTANYIENEFRVQKLKHEVIEVLSSPDQENVKPR